MARSFGMSGHTLFTIESTTYQESIKYTAHITFATFKTVECSLYSVDPNTAASVYNKAEVDAPVQTAAPNTTITHLTTTSEPIEHCKVSYLVFASGTLGYGRSPKDAAHPYPEKRSTTDCICALKPRGSYEESVGICTRLHADCNELTFTAHGDYLFHVDNSSMCGIGGCIMFNGQTVNDEIPLTNRVARSIVGIITATPTANTVAVFRY